MFVPESFRQVLPRCAVIVLGALAFACSPEAGKVEELDPPEGPFTVSDYFAASGAMGDGATSGHITIYTSQNCKERPEGARGHCYSFDYTAGPMLWAGVYWQYPVNNWGAEPGLPVPGEKLTKLTWKAAVAEGTEPIKFVIGGIGTDPPMEGADVFPNKDQTKLEVFYDVTTEWQTFELPVPPDLTTNAPITELIGAFAWYANYEMDTDYTTAPPKTIYVDDIAFE